MNDPKICPNCKKEMEKGVLGTDYQSWMSEDSAMAKLNWLAQPPVFGQPRLLTYRCPNCGKVELYSEVEK